VGSTGDVLEDPAGELRKPHGYFWIITSADVTTAAYELLLGPPLATATFHSS
jgi:hypothetical protein